MKNKSILLATAAVIGEAYLTDRYLSYRNAMIGWSGAQVATSNESSSDKNVAPLVTGAVVSVLVGALFSEAFVQRTRSLANLGLCFVSGAVASKVALRIQETS